jgi:hypothetical protein
MAWWSSHIMRFRQTSDFISCKNSGTETFDKILCKRNHQVYSSETEGLKNEMIAAKKAMPGINRH